MKDSRSAKKRKVSESRELDEDGDTAMRGGDGDVYSVPSSPERQDGNQGYTSPTPTRASRRRSLRGHATAEEKKVDERESEGANGTETPSRTGLRSSGRQRKAPKTYWEEIHEPPESEKKSTPMSTERSGVTRNARKTRRTSEVDETDWESPQPQRYAPTRTRRSRASVRFNTKDQSDGEDVLGKGDVQSGPEEYQDGLDDLVSMQFQPDLPLQDLDVKDSSVSAAEPLPGYAEEFQSFVKEGLYDELGIMTRFVLEKLNGKRPIPLKGLENEYQKVHHLIEQTVTAGEGNSMLVYGSRGCGKTAIVETVISSLKTEHGNDFHVVRLNGFLQTDDRLALREMWRQLGRETNTEDEADKVSSYADTMATLLALLSHPEELFGPSGSKDGVAAKSVVIILDEFDLFVSHARQTLLYNLFDIAQARKAPVAVIGLTTKVDITEILEKRVKSRFSHRYVFVPLPKSLDTFSDICHTGLNVDESEIPEFNAFSGAHERSITKSKNWGTLLGGWREYLKSLWSDEEFQFHLERIYHQTKSAKEFFTSSLLAISELHLSSYYAPDEPTALQVPTPKSFSNQTLSCPDPAPLPFDTSTTASASPSSLPLSLLLAATRLTALYDPGNDGAQPQSLAPLALSFPAAYTEYVRLLTSAKTSASVSGATATPGRVWGRDVAREAWEKLVTWGVVCPVGGGSGTADSRMFRVEVSFEEVVEMAGYRGSLGRWWRDG